MSDYISREAAIQVIYAQHADGQRGVDNALPNTFGEELRDIRDDLIMLPAAEVRPVVRGEWIERNMINNLQHSYLQSARCSKCGKYHTTPYLYYFTEYPFCPWCGAEMKGKDNG